MSDSVVQISNRIRELREISDISQQELANKLNISLETYMEYENANVGIPISTLYEIAGYLGVEFSELLTGSTPRLHNYCYVKKGEAPFIERFKGYQFQNLAYNFRNKKVEPLLVTIEPEENKEMSLVTHGGQEFNYVLEGQIKIILGSSEIIMSEGDSIYFDPTIPHGQAAVDNKPGKFLTIILHDEGGTPNA